MRPKCKPHCAKGAALARLCAELDIVAEEVVAFGDNLNDLTMLEWAGRSAAPAHCDHYARAAANQIVPGPGVSGVADLLQSITG